MTFSKQDTPYKMKQMSLIGIAALLHSQIFWVYSIIYIAYHKITPKDEIQTIRWKPKKDTPTKKRKHHHRKKSLTNKPKSVIIPTIIPTKGTVAFSLGTTNNLSQNKTALRTFPSSTKNPIKSQRKLFLRDSSTGQLNVSSLPALIEVDTRSSEESSICSSSNEEYTSKRERAIDLLRSTFQRNHSSNTLLENSFTSSISSEEEETIVVIEEKKRKRDAIFGITRKFSERVIVHHSNILADEEIKKQPKPKLFRSLPSWKKGK